MKNFINRIKLIGLLLFWGITANAQKQIINVWSQEKANTWYAKYKWVNGADFIPSTAINQLEMWQADTFDPGTIDRELGWAEGIGFNTMRVFLHSVAWNEDHQGFKDRVNKYLAIADKHHIKTIFVFFDDCWNATPKPVSSRNLNQESIILGGCRTRAGQSAPRWIMQCLKPTLMMY